MSANINFANDKYAFASAKVKAWHGLGEVVDEAMTSDQAIKLAGLNYEVETRPLYADSGVRNPEASFEDDNQSVIAIRNSGIVTRHASITELPNNFATMRMDTNEVFGVVGNKYEVVQNREAFDFFDNLIGDKVAIFETAGALGKGETVFMTAKLPNDLFIGKDVIEQYLLLTNNHDGKGSIQVMFTPIRVVCNNTLSAAVSGAINKVSIRHTKSAHTTLENAGKVLGLIHKASSAYEAVFNVMAKTRITDTDLRNIIGYTFLSPMELTDLAKSGGNIDATKKENGTESRIISMKKRNIIGNVYEYAKQGVGQETLETEGTIYGAYNAVTGYFQNVKEFSNQETKFKSNLFGNNKTIMQKAFDSCLNYSN